jgi:hypothetical protein
VVVAGVAAGFALYSRIDDEICRGVEAIFAKHYPGLKVTLRSAERVEKGIRVHDLSIVERDAQGPHAEILHVEEALLECSTDLKDLLKGNLLVRRVTIHRPTLHVTHRPDGTWSAAKLLPPPQLGDHPPEVIVDGGVIDIFDPLEARARTLTLREVNFSLVPDIKPRPVVASGGATTGRGFVGTARQLHGMFSGDGFRRVEIEGWVDLQRPACSIRGRAEALELSPELRDSLPNPLGEKLRVLPDLRGQIDLRFELNYDPAATPPLKYDLSGRLNHGRIDDPRLPHALSEIRATVHVDNSGYTIDDAVGRSGQATLRLGCRGSGFEPGSPLRLTAELRQFDLDRAVLDVLPQWAQDLRYKYLPAGEVDADVRLAFDGQTWQQDVEVRCLNVSFTHHKFPYRLDHGRGTLNLKDDQLTMNLTAYSESQPIRLAAEVAHPFSGSTGWFEAKGDDLPLDEALLRALPPKPQEVVRSLHPRGTINFDVKLWRNRPEEPMHQHLWLAANHCSIRYERFPYPISDIRGVLDMVDGVWTFSNVEGSNDKARIVCKGSLGPGLQGTELSLDIAGQDVPLHEDLRNALSPHIQQVWNDVRPRGAVDVQADVRYLSGENTFSVGVRAQPQRDNSSIEPVRFPYRLDHLQGVLAYRDGHVTFERCKGEHGAVKISTEGFCDFPSDGRWKIHFARLSADRLRGADRELVQALPERLRKAMIELNPTGTINLDGSLDLERAGRPGEPLLSRWDARLGLQQSNVQVGGILVENVHGEVSLQGGFDGQQLRSRGALAIDSLNYKDCQFTQVLGPIWIDDGRVLFGSFVENAAVAADPTAPRRVPLPITARLCGGTFYADGWATIEPNPHYAVQARLADADLALCAREFATGRQNLRGKIMAKVDLTGTGRTRNTLSGVGGIRLSNANVYELPVMVSILSFFSLQLPKQNAFSDAAIDYRIEGEHIYLNPIEFRGDAISLHGTGQMDFKSNIGLKFCVTLGRGELDMPLLKQFVRGAAEQIMTIYVGGTLQNPETRRETLPAVNQALQPFRDELQDRR